MKGSHSRLLQLVVAGLLLNPVADATATTYNDDRFIVTDKGYFDDFSASSDYYAGVTEMLLRDFDYSSAGSGGGELSDGAVMDAVCKAFRDAAPASCDFLNPPVFLSNGCGGGPFTYLVPDYLVVNGTPVTRLGAIFSESCNRHDLCYSTHLSDKDECDARLGRDMVERAKDRLTPTQWLYYEQHVRFQAAMYNTALQTPPTLAVANLLYENAQADGACREYAAKSQSAGCND